MTVEYCFVCSGKLILEPNPAMALILDEKVLCVRCFALDTRKRIIQLEAWVQQKELQWENEAYEQSEQEEPGG